MRGFRYVRPENWSDRSHQMMFCVRLDGCSSGSGVVFPSLTVKLEGHCRQRVTADAGVSALSSEGTLGRLPFSSVLDQRSLHDCAT